MTRKINIMRKMVKISRKIRWTYFDGLEIDIAQSINISSLHCLRDILGIEAEIQFVRGLFSLRIRSMWETICDAWACWNGWNFGPNPTEYPYSVEYPTSPPPPPSPPFQNENCPNLRCPRIPPPQMKIVRESKSEVSQNTPPQWKLSESPNPRCPRIPPPQWKLS